HDAGTVGVTPHGDDAAVVVAPGADAEVVAHPTPDAGTVTAPRDEDVTIAIKTDPPGSIIELGGDKIGKGKATVTRKKGTKVQVTCKQIGFEDKEMTIVFKKDAAVTCKQAPHCDPDLQNP